MASAAKKLPVKVIYDSPGQPTRYRPEYCAQVIEYMGEGHGLAAFAGLIGVSFQTVYNWEKAFPEFKEACDIGRGKRIGVIENTLNKPKSGPQAATAIFLSKNVMPSEYREKIEFVPDGAGEAGLAAMKTAVSAGVTDALKQLGSQAVSVMAGMRVISHDVSHDSPTPAVIEGEFEDVTPDSATPKAHNDSASWV